MATKYNADHIGSLLRPDYLLKARHENAAQDEIEKLEDRAIIEVLKYQEDIGLPIVTDGEFRRTLWMKVLTDVIEGFDPEGYERYHRDDEGHVETFGVPTPVSKLKRKASWVDVEFNFVKQHTAKDVKITMPSPSLMLSYWKEGVSDKAYESKDAFMADLVKLMNEDTKNLAAAGCAYVQVDAPQYTYITDKNIRPDVTDPIGTLKKMIAVDNGVFEGVTGATTALHLCRGNYKSKYTGTKPYDEYAEVVFSESKFDRLLLEYDDARAGDFSALRFVPKHATVVLGLVTTKTSVVESEDDLRRRIDEAAEYIPLERLALSPQCGFATVQEGNDITHDAEKRKLELIVRTAEKVWGHA